MDKIRYIYRYIKNSIIRLIGIAQGHKMNIPDSAIIISPHPDDEILGCGGLISHLVSKKCDVTIIMLTGGENCDDAMHLGPEKLKKERRKLTKQACSVLGVEERNIFFLDFIDGAINAQDKELEKLINIIKDTNAKTIFVPHIEDGWNDHVQTHHIIKNMIKGTSLSLYAYCVWFWYTMPFNKVLSLDWKNLNYLKINKEEHSLKKIAIDIYMNAVSPEGIFYSGKLPKILIESCSNKREFYFKINQ